MLRYCSLDDEANDFGLLPSLARRETFSGRGAGEMKRQLTVTEQWKKAIWHHWKYSPGYKKKKKKKITGSRLTVSCFPMVPAWKMKNTGLDHQPFIPLFFSFLLISIIAAFTISLKLFSLINLSVAVLLTTFTGAAANAHRFKSATWQHVPLSGQVLP